MSWSAKATSEEVTGLMIETQTLLGILMVPRCVLYGILNREPGENPGLSRSGIW